MEKLSCLLVVVGDLASSAVLLDKAAILARRCGARIDVLPANPTDTCTLAGWFSARGFGSDVSYAARCSDEPMSVAIARTAESRRADLVMKSAESSTPLRRLLRAADDIALAGTLDMPLMRVGARPWRADMRFAAAVDVSLREGDAVARSILHAAGLLATHCEATINVLYSERESSDETVRMERAVRVARMVREFRIGGERLRVLNGAPENTLPKVVSSGDYDVVFVGAAPSRPVSPIWGPSLTSLLADASVADVMFVKKAERREREPVGAREAEHADHP